MSKCYNCGADIDSDSLFCDQCGAEQYVCPKCHIIGKGPNKRCGMCGSPLVPATGQQDNNSTQQQGAAQQQEATRMASYLVCQAEKVSIPLMNGAVIGRTAGDYANLLGKCVYISGMHARLTQNGSVWHITDLGSRNGTKVNGVACQPNVPMAFKTGDTIKLGAFYDFKAE